MPPPAGLTPTALRSFGDLVAPLRTNLAEINVRTADEEFTLTRVVEERYGTYLERGTASEGRATGYVDAVNVHDELVFYLYPTLLPGRIACHFGREMLDVVRRSIKKYVTVEGLLLYEGGRLAPKRVDAHRIVVHPAPDSLPTLRSLLGLAPDLTDGLDSVTYVKRIRDAQA